MFIHNNFIKPLTKPYYVQNGYISFLKIKITKINNRF